jgi:DNA-binding MltR family transcriptional regulator
MFDDIAIKAAADAMIQFGVNEAHKIIEDSGFDTSDIQPLARRLIKESEVGQVLIFSAYLEEQFKTLLCLHMHDVNNNEAKNRLFDMAGVLDSFSKRILLSYHLGWLRKETQQSLNQLRQIRNEYAHRAFNLSPSDPKIKSHWARLETAHRPTLDKMLEAHEQFKEYRNPPESAVRLAILVLIALAVVEDLMVLPVAMRVRVDPGHIMGDYSKLPTRLKRHLLDFTEACLEIFYYTKNPTTL